MRHSKKKNTLVSKHGGARCVVRNLATSLIMFDSISTTKRKANAAAMAVDNLIAYAKKHDSVNAIRKLNSFLYREEACRKVMDILLERYKERPSGFTSIQRTKLRRGDGAEEFRVSLMD